MPSVGMRRTTRVFGMVKSFDGARVLRSGRRLWPEKSGEEANKWHEPIKNNNKNHNNNKNNNKENGWSHDEVNHKTNNNVKETKPLKRKAVKRKARDDGTKNNSVAADRRFGIVYTRKRKRSNEQKSKFDADNKLSKRETESLVGFGETDDSWGLVSDKAFAAVVVSKRLCGFSWFIYTIFRYMTRKSLELDELAGILSSQPINDAYSSLGLQFSWDPHNITGICKFFGARQYVPLFSVDFSAVPLCFMYMQRSMLLRFEFLQFIFVNKLARLHATNGITTGSEEEEGDDEAEMGEPSERALPVGVVIGLTAPQVDNSGNRVLVRPYVRASKPAGRSSQHRNGLNSRGIQKSRSPLKRRRPRNPSLGGVLKAKGALVSDLVSSRRNSIPFSSVVPKYKLRSSAQRSTAANLKKVSSTMAALKMKPNRDSSGCVANILVIEADKCYREEGASVMLEKSTSGEWLLVVKKDGLMRYTHKPEKSMRPPACNRFTHAMMCMVDDSWKLEFPSRRDWFIFKDLYKECADHNVPEPVVRVIPVPGVHEVSGCDDVIITPFHRPDSYISTNGDEVFRALAKQTANYDMDSEDEEWLKKFNNDFFTGSSVHEHVSIDNFELMVDSFEKAFYCSPEDFPDEKAAPNVGPDFGRREVVEAVYGYWMRKRKQKRSALVKVFQLHKRPSLLPKQPPRKKRSFKRQASQSGRGKPPSFLQVAGEGDASAEQNVMLKVEEAKAAAERAIEQAILKRQRAQVLLENANMATYKATMALRIAEAAQVFGSSEAAVTHFFE